MTAKYRNIVNELELELKQMHSEGKTRLPSEKDLCEVYSCSRQTIRTSLNVLEQKGLIVKIKGSGSYISDAIENTSDTVIFITEDQDGYIYPSLIEQLKKDLNLKKLKLKVESTGASISREKKSLLDVIESHAAAVIIDPIRNMVPNSNVDLIDKIKSLDIPVIFLGSPYQNLDDTLMINEDNVEGSNLLVRHLFENGHKKISGVFRVDDAKGLMRYQGTMNAINDNGLTFNEENFMLITHSDERKISCGDHGILNMFMTECLKDNDAIICQNDIIAYHLINTLNKKGIRVPEDVAVVSFDNSYLSSKDMKITSIGHNEKALVNAITESILSSISHKKKKYPVIPWELHVRQSSKR
ncbi:MAG: substrate-binding domain-containing protein [Clostridiales bacterium]|nr:substrate-binding domain-containing protein [Clostridiales bacterium]